MGKISLFSIGIIAATLGTACHQLPKANDANPPAPTHTKPADAVNYKSTCTITTRYNSAANGKSEQVQLLETTGDEAQLPDGQTQSHSDTKITRTFFTLSDSGEKTQTSKSIETDNRVSYIKIETVENNVTLTTEGASGVMKALEGVSYSTPDGSKINNKYYNSKYQYRIYDDGTLQYAIENEENGEPTYVEPGHYIVSNTTSEDGRTTITTSTLTKPFLNTNNETIESKTKECKKEIL